jgi:predicted ATPase
MSENKLIKSLRLKNFLSFGGEGKTIELQPLNVLIGANASGKSNFIEVFLLLRALTGDFAQALRNGGGVGEYISKLEGAGPIAEIELVMSPQEGSECDGLEYEIGFTRVGQTFEITHERLADFNSPNSMRVPDFVIGEIPSYYGRTYYRLQGSEGFIYSNINNSIENLKVGIEANSISSQNSILSQRRDPQNYSQLTVVAKNFEQIKLYKEWQFTQYQKPRIPADTSLPSDFLWEEAENLALVMNDLENKPNAYKQIIEELRNLYPEVEKINTLVQGSTIQLYLVEKNLMKPVPAIRLSDGTLRFLCLLSILCHPTPPPLICIEEPEIGLHPDMLSTIAKLLIEASTRTQLIVTTHSDILVSAIARISDSPEAIIVCERDADGTHLHRLESEKLNAWLEDYSLGEVWLKGFIGGTRW